MMEIVGTIIVFISGIAFFAALFYWVTIPLSRVGMALEACTEYEKQAGKEYDFQSDYRCFCEIYERLSRYYYRSIICIIIIFGCPAAALIKNGRWLEAAFLVAMAITFFACLKFNLGESSRAGTENISYLWKCVHDFVKLKDIPYPERYDYDTANEYDSACDEWDGFRNRMISITQSVTAAMDVSIHTGLVYISSTMTLAFLSTGFLAFVF